MQHSLPLKQRRLKMNRENYKPDRKKPKPTNSISRIKKQMLTKPKMITAESAQKLQKAYSSKTEWTAKVIPKQKNQ
jgi:hypothetical protein